MKKTNKEKGITIVALTITIIVMIILTGVTIIATVSEDGIITKVKDTAKDSFNNNISEALMTMQTPYTSILEYMEYLKQNEYIDKNNIVNVKKLLQVSTIDKGNGKEDKDIYKIEYDGNTTLILNYYDQNSTKQKIADLGLTMEK